MAHPLSGGILIDPALIAMYGRSAGVSGGSDASPFKNATPATAASRKKASCAKLRTPSKATTDTMDVEGISLLDPALFAIQGVNSPVAAAPPSSRTAVATASIPAAQTAASETALRQTSTVLEGESSAPGHVLHTGTTQDLQIGEESADLAGQTEDLEPSIREIVNSLKNAQQDHGTPAPSYGVLPPTFSQPSGPTRSQTGLDDLEHALDEHETAAAISAQMLEESNMGMHRGMRPDLGGLTAEHLDPFWLSSHPPDFGLPEYTPGDTEAGPSRHRHDVHPPAHHDSTHSMLEREYLTPSRIDTADNASSFEIPVKRGRGRPKGSKNKPKVLDGTGDSATDHQRVSKARKVVRDPVAPKEKRPIGRPPKIRHGAELEAFLKRKADAEQGIKPTRGRPRKFPGYLIREMRLKHNREEFREVVRRAAEEAETEALAQAAAGPEGAAGLAIDDEYVYDWTTDPQNLMDAVNGNFGDPTATQPALSHGEEGALEAVEEDS